MPSIGAKTGGTLLSLIPAADVDPFWDDVQFASIFTGLGPTLSPYNAPLTMLGGPALDGDKLNMDNGSLDGARWAAADVDILSGDFTVEVFGLAPLENDRGWIVGEDGNSGNYGWSIRRRPSPDRWVVFISENGSSNALSTNTYNQTLTLSQEYNICLERSGNDIRFYIDGTMVLKETFTGTINASNVLALGRNPNDSSDRFYGSAKALRITGAARYDDDGGYTVPELPFPTEDIGIYGRRLSEGVLHWRHGPPVALIGSDPVIGCIARNFDEDLKIYNPTDDTYAIIEEDFASNDHAAPAVLHLDSGRIRVWATEGNASSGLYTWLSSSDDDMTAFGSSTDLDSQLGLNNYTYVDAIQLLGETDDPVHIFFRAANSGDNDWYHAISTDDGGELRNAYKFPSGRCPFREKLFRRIPDDRYPDRLRLHEQHSGN